MGVITREIAEAEITAWLDKKKIMSQQREENKSSIDTLIEAIVEGVLVLDSDTNTFTHKLLFQMDGEMPVTELTYKPRLNDNMLRPYLSGVKPADVDARILAYMAALTGKAKGILSALDTADKRIATSIVLFFL